MAYSAGCLPFNVINGKLYFLLGKDRSDGTWSDFGGRAEDFDEDVKATAAREFYEESMGVVMEYDSIVKRLRDPDCHKLLESRTMGGAKYYMYLIHCPYHPWYGGVFDRNLKLLRYVKAHRRFLEKVSISWHSADEIFRSLDGFNGKLRLRGIFESSLRMHRDVIETADSLVINRYPSPNKYFVEAERSP